MVVVDEVLYADQEHVYSSRPFHRKVLGIVPGKMETLQVIENPKESSVNIYNVVMI